MVIWRVERDPGRFPDLARRDVHRDGVKVHGDGANGCAIRGVLILLIEPWREKITALEGAIVHDDIATDFGDPARSDFGGPVEHVLAQQEPLAITCDIDGARDLFTIDLLGKNARGEGVLWPEHIERGGAGDKLRVGGRVVELVRVVRVEFLPRLHVDDMNPDARPLELLVLEQTIERALELGDRVRRGGLGGRHARGDLFLRREVSERREQEAGEEQDGENKSGAHDDLKPLERPVGGDKGPRRVVSRQQDLSRGSRQIAQHLHNLATSARDARGCHEVIKIKVWQVASLSRRCPGLARTCRWSGRLCASRSRAATP